MEWTADVEAGGWIRDRLDNGPAWGASLHAVVPRGFEAYARVFHPATRDRPVGMPWPGLPYRRYAKDWDAFQAAQPEIDSERVTWRDTANAFDTTMHPLAQWHRIVGPRQIEGEDGPRDAAGWRYADPTEGSLDPDLVAAIAGRLARHTATPDDGYIALWDGWGGLVGGVGYGPSRALYAADDDGPDDARHQAFLSHAARDMFNDVFRKPSWQPGVLADDISRGPRLSLPNRDHVLFVAGVSELAEPEWSLRAPWRDRELEAQGSPPTAQSPSLVWPTDHAWVLVTEVDFDSTIVGGSSELVRALCADGRIEALPIPADADLTADGDDVNR